MIKQSALVVPIISLCVLGIILSANSLTFVSAQSRKLKRKETTSGTVIKSCGKFTKKFEAGKPMKLFLMSCSGQVNLPDIGISSTHLNIDGNKITLRAEDGTEIQGEVSAHALSQYCINANIGLFFNRMENVSFTNPNWAPPKVFSLRLMQISADQFTLTPAPGANLLPGTGGKFTCQDTSSTTTEAQ